MSLPELRRRFGFENAPEIVGVEVVEGLDDSELLRRVGCRASVVTERQLRRVRRGAEVG